ncbi:MAG: hypothetical protein MEPRV_01161 [Providencia sp.]
MISRALSINGLALLGLSLPPAGDFPLPPSPPVPVALLPIITGANNWLLRNSFSRSSIVNADG